MPELAEVHTLAAQLNATLKGLAVSGLEILNPRWLAAGDPATLTGRTVLSVGRWGKRMIWRFDDGQILIVGLGMTGGFIVGDQPADKHTGAVIRFDGGARVRYQDPRKFGRAHLFAGEQQMHDALDARIGPDAAGPLSWQQLKEAAGRGRMPVKAALLAQERISGLGNYMGSEICHRARVHPQTSVGELTRRDWIALNRARMQMVTAALNAGGLSFSDYRHADGSLGDMLRRLRVYGREGQPCVSCAAPIAATTIAGRSTFHCPSCQPDRQAR